MRISELIKKLTDVLSDDGDGPIVILQNDDETYRNVKTLEFPAVREESWGYISVDDTDPNPMNHVHVCAIIS